MEFKVKEVEGSEEKSTQQLEQELLQKHEVKNSETTSEETSVVDTPVEETKVEEPKAEENIEENTTQSSELNEEDVLSFIKNRYGKDINSLSELNEQREESPLPEDVSTYLKYIKDTGRGFDDFAKLQKNYDEMEPDKLLREYLTATEKGLDSDDITDLMEDYVYDEDIDDDKQIRKIKLAKKKTIAKAKDYFEQQQELYRVPLESKRDAGSQAEDEDFTAYKQYIAEAKTVEEQNSRKREMFTKKTEDVFSEFKGFEFTLDDKKVTFSPGDATELKKIQSDPQNFISKFLNEDGLIDDAVGYHKALSIAMNPEKFANFFYSQGKAEATDDVIRKTKNINMSERKTPEITSKGGMQIKSLDKDSGRGLRIRSKK